MSFSAYVGRDWYNVPFLSQGTTADLHCMVLPILVKSRGIALVTGKSTCLQGMKSLACHLKVLFTITMESICQLHLYQLKLSLTSSRLKQEMETGNGTQKMNNEIRKLLYFLAVCNVLERFNLVSSVTASWYQNSYFLHKRNSLMLER